MKRFTENNTGFLFKKLIKSVKICVSNRHLRQLRAKVSYVVATRKQQIKYRFALTKFLKSVKKICFADRYLRHLRGKVGYVIETRNPRI